MAGYYKDEKVDEETGAIKRPITMANSYELPYDPTAINWSSAEGKLYTRNGGSNHGDAMGGSIVGKKEYLDQIRAQSQVNLGATISPFNAWLIMRGSVTLPLRMRQHNENAMAAEKWLEAQPCVSFLKVITSAVSLGHDESLIVFLGEDDERQYLYPEQFHNGFFRFSVGIEDIWDIIGDLKQAMENCGLETIVE